MYEYSRFLARKDWRRMPSHPKIFQFLLARNYLDQTTQEIKKLEVASLLPKVMQGVFLIMCLSCSATAEFLPEYQCVQGLC
jgi:hypothetical protein